LQLPGQETGEDRDREGALAGKQDEENNTKEFKDPMPDEAHLDANTESKGIDPRLTSASNPGRKRKTFFGFFFGRRSDRTRSAAEPMRTSRNTFFRRNPKKAEGDVQAVSSHQGGEETARNPNA
jgi:hypothetical protein